VDRDISAAILKLHNMTMHVTWDEEAEVGTVQATVLRGRRMIAPSSTLDGRSDLGFDLRANGEALTLSVVQGGTTLLATRDVSVEVFNNCKVVNERFEVDSRGVHTIASSKLGEEADTWAIFSSP